MSVFSWLNQLYAPAKADRHSFEAPFLDEKGTVIESIKPGGEGVIKLQGVYWVAKSSVALQWPIPINTLVAIKARKGLTLIVEPLFAVRQIRSQPLTSLASYKSASSTSISSRSANLKRENCFRASTAV